MTYHGNFYDNLAQCHCLTITSFWAWFVSPAIALIAQDMIVSSSMVPAFCGMTQYHNDTSIWEQKELIGGCLAWTSQSNYKTIYLNVPEYQLYGLQHTSGV